MHSYYLCPQFKIMQKYNVVLYSTSAHKYTHRNHIEASTGFEEHVLLDHLLEGFPKRGESVCTQTEHYHAWPL